METQALFNHAQRYVADVKEGKILIVDTLASESVFVRLDESEHNKKAIIPLCALMNAYWKEIVTLRKEVSK